MRCAPHHLSPHLQAAPTSPPPTVAATAMPILVAAIAATAAIAAAPAHCRRRFCPSRHDHRCPSPLPPHSPSPPPPPSPPPSSPVAAADDAVKRILSPHAVRGGRRPTQTSTHQLRAYIQCTAGEWQQHRAIQFTTVNAKYPAKWKSRDSTLRAAPTCPRK